MSTLLRGGVRAERWYRESTWDWLEKPEFPADALKDLRTDNNSLSVFEVENEADARAAAIAIAAGRQDFGDCEWFLFDDSVLDALNIPIEKSEGTTPNTRINELHRNISHLTGRKLAALVEAISPDPETFGFVLKKDVESTIVASVKSGELDIYRVNRSLREKVIAKL